MILRPNVEAHDDPSRVIGRRTTYHGDEHPYLRGYDVVIVAVLKGALRIEEYGHLTTDEEVRGAGGVSADDRIEVAPFLPKEGHLSFVTRLLALLLLHDARRGARLNEKGEAVPLPEQDRARWDSGAIVSATALLERALAAGKPGPFQIEAAISAVHCRARRPEDTDWREIASLYSLLESFRLTPAIRVNRAFAVARADGAAAGLALLDGDSATDAAGYPYVHLVRGTLLEELGRVDEARMSLALASQHARNAHERAQIQARIERLSAAQRGSSS